MERIQHVRFGAGAGYGVGGVEEASEWPSTLPLYTTTLQKFSQVCFALFTISIYLYCFPSPSSIYI
jgi:hypothetical protein